MNLQVAKRRRGIAARCGPRIAAIFALLCLGWATLSLGRGEAAPKMSILCGIRIVTPLAAGSASDVALRISLRNYRIASACRCWCRTSWSAAGSSPGVR